MVTSEPVRIMFFHADMLGWSTYSKILEAYVSEREDVDGYFVRQGKKKVIRPFRKVIKSTSVANQVARSLRRNVAGGIKYYQALHRIKPCLIHVAGHSLARVPTALGADVPIIATSDGTEYQSRRMTGGKDEGRSKSWRREQKLLVKLDEIHCTSEWAAQSVTEEFSISTSKVRVTPYALQPPSTNVGKLKQPRNKLLNLMFVGNDYTRKGALELIKIHQSRFLKRCKLHIFSKEIPHDFFGENIVLHRNVEHTELMDNWYPKMDVFVLPTHFDQTPFVVIEALSQGLPIIVTDVGGLPGLVNYGEAGIVVPRSDENSLLGALESLLSGVELRQSLSIKATQRFNQHYNANVVVPRFIDRLVKLSKKQNV